MQNFWLWSLKLQVESKEIKANKNNASYPFVSNLRRESGEKCCVVTGVASHMEASDELCCDLCYHPSWQSRIIGLCLRQRRDCLLRDKIVTSHDKDCGMLL